MKDLPRFKNICILNKPGDAYLAPKERRICTREYLPKGSSCGCRGPVLNPFDTCAGIILS
jgi:hypothetical protein